VKASKYLFYEVLSVAKDEKFPKEQHCRKCNPNVITSAIKTKLT